MLRLKISYDQPNTPVVKAIGDYNVILINVSIAFIGDILILLLVSAEMS